MITLAVGVALFVGVHMIPAVAPVRRRLVERLGENRYKGLFSMLVVTGLVLMIIGKINAPFVHVFVPPVFSRHLALTLMPLSSILLMAAYLPGYLRRWARHPMLLGIALWAGCHTLANGDAASLCLFGGMLAFAVLDLLSHLFRPKSAEKPAHVWADGVAVAVGVGSYALTVYLHANLFGPPVWY